MTDNLLRATGEALYGPLWQSQLARDLDISDRHMRRLIAGDADLKPGMIADLLHIARERAATLAGIIQQLENIDYPDGGK